ncbi:MAG: FHA domain-containing protein [Gammaproteobacteria bacterium]|nr:FHA domain-containing protein [Gammaproteobacteria bacterium]MCI0591638.1 FHA domain-containing protein [Gammaproteobacteria bacterium]
MRRSVTSLVLTFNLLLSANASPVTSGTILPTDIRLPASTLPESRGPDVGTGATDEPPATIVAASNSPSAPISQRTHAVDERPSHVPRLWYSIPIALIILILLIAGALAFRWHRHELERIRQAARPYAYLVLQEDKETRFPIMGSTWRIGRSKHNEVVLKHHSVSSRHAEIHHRHHGTFRIVDLDSLNGIYVNDKKVKSCNLFEGDLIDMGDVRLRFTFDAGDYPAEETTLRLHTNDQSKHAP